MATTALILGLSSVLVPLLSIPGVILGVVSLRRIKRHPWLSGRGRSIAGIVTSLILGPLAAVGAVFVLVAASNHLDMSRVQSGVRSLLQTQVQQQSGILLDFQVRCPNSEPRQTGRVFYCAAVVTETGAQLTAEIRETDSHGDYLIEGVRLTKPASRSVAPPRGPSPVASSPPSTAPAAASAAKAPAPAPVITGVPTNGEVAVIRIDAIGHHLTLETALQDINYHTCSQFQAVSASGNQLGLSALVAGDFATAEIDTTVPCVRQVTLLAAPGPPQCIISGLPGSALVIWEGFNQNAHSVLYRPTGAGEPVVADRWCATPTVVGADTSASTLSQIRQGAQVKLLLSGDGEWVTSVTVVS